MEVSVTVGALKGQEVSAEKKEVNAVGMKAAWCGTVRRWSVCWFVNPGRKLECHHSKVKYVKRLMVEIGNIK